MIIQFLQGLRKYDPPTKISFSPDPTIVNKYDKRQDLVKFDIKTQTGNISNKIVSLYILVFKIGLAKSLLKLLFLLNNILKVNKLTTVPQMYSMTKNFLAVQDLPSFKKKS